METFAKETLPISLEDEMRRSYLDYAMSVIVGRALPDARDGLKPVHRRVLFAMHELGNDWNKAYKKSARIVGDVIGKYHPHGDMAVYDTIVRMAQDFSLRYMLVDGQGNFGSIDGDNAAAMRYTEVRMARIGHELLADIDKETVDFGPNYDGSEQEPLILPARIPNLLINGSSGIAVGMATNIPPHNINEVIDGCLALLHHPEMTVDELIEIIPAPDFPTAGIIYGVSGVREGYQTGRGRVVMRARTHFEDIKGSNDRQAIIVDELPYQVNKRSLLEKIGELVNDKRIEGIADLRDESDKSGMRVVIELKRNEVPEVVLNCLYKQTQLQDTFGMNMVALVDGQPRLINLKQMLDCFLSHRREVITRRTVFELRKARERAHIQEGLAVALDNVDEIIALIKASPTPADARRGLMSRLWQSATVGEMLQRAALDATRPEGLALEYGLSKSGYLLSEAQAQAILELRLQRLTGLERDRILEEDRQLREKCVYLRSILEDEHKLLGVIREEVLAIKEKHNDPRRTEITRFFDDIEMDDVIEVEEMAVTMTHFGYIKRLSPDTYRAQNRGGKGVKGQGTREEDFVERMFVTSTHNELLFFTSRGRAFRIKCYLIPEAGRAAKGLPVVNLLQLGEGETVTAVFPLTGEIDDEYTYLVTATRDGLIKKTRLADCRNIRKGGLNVQTLRDGDELISAELTTGTDEFLIASRKGKCIRFAEKDVRDTGRGGMGVRAIRLGADDAVVDMVKVIDGASVLTVTENGMGKRTEQEQYSIQGRGGKGLNAMKLTERTGDLACMRMVVGDEDLILMRDDGMVMRMPVDQLPLIGRATQGVILMRVQDGTRVACVELVPHQEPEPDDEDLDEMTADATPDDVADDAAEAADPAPSEPVDE